MAPTLPDDADAWVDDLRTRLNDREAFATAAAGFDAAFRFEILPDEDYLGEPVAFAVTVEDGSCVAAAAGDRETEYDFALRGPYAAWKALLEDDLDVAEAVMGGPFDVEGSTMRLLSNREAVAELVRAARTVDAEFAY
ncbi:MAG: SCP2 sterol-binding domain-containing protein [Haloarculaceae archaeon]